MWMPIYHPTRTQLVRGPQALLIGCSLVGPAPWHPRFFDSLELGIA